MQDCVPVFFRRYGVLRGVVNAFFYRLIWVNPVPIRTTDSAFCDGWSIGVNVDFGCNYCFPLSVWPLREVRRVLFGAAEIVRRSVESVIIPDVRHILAEHITV